MSAERQGVAKGVLLRPMPWRAPFLPITLLVLGACQRDERAPLSRSGASASARPLVPPASQDTGFAGTTSAVHRPRPGVPPRILRAVDARASPGYDRITFEFTGDSLPGYHVEYTSGPVRRCGSGDPVAVTGAAKLLVRLEPAQAHDERGNATLTERDRTLGLPAARDLKLVCDVEGQVEWVLGVAVAGPYRVSELAGPARLVLDVRHGQ